MKTILVVDNEQESISLLSEILHRFGYNVMTVQNGQSALSVLKEDAAVDLVLTEEHLPDMDGLELIESLKKIRPIIPIIILTKHCSIETYLKAFNLGVFDYVNKPVSIKAIGRVLHAALEGVPHHLSLVATFLGHFLMDQQSVLRT